MTLTDVITINNVADDRGGGICNRESGTLTMTGGAITNNHSNDQSGAKGGGGFFNEAGATATLTGVTITCNEATVCGGGGICNFGTLTLDGCTLQNNAANTHGGGIWQEGTLNMQGTNIINDNWKTNGMRSNLYLKNGTLINITGSLADSKVFVDMETLGTFTSGYSTYNDGHPAGFFTADKQSVTGMRLVNGEAQLDNAIPEGGVYYIERSWNETAKRVEAAYRVCESYTTLTGSDDDTYLDPGWYVVKGSDVVYDDFLYMNGGGEYHLILCDGASIKAMFFIVESPNILHIHGQSDNTGKMISTYVYNFTAHKCAGIGGTYHHANGPIFIHGGDIDVHATLSSAGIGGGGYTSQGGAVTIYGGTVRTEGGWEPGGNAGETTGGGAGIGGGRNGDGGVVNIYGGSVYATGRGSTTGGAGIGSGSYAESSGTISIYGGYVEAKGYDGAAGIGGGTGTNGADVTIHGGTVKAEGKSEGPGIGAGKNDDERITYAGTLTVTGGKVYAYGGERGAGIGGGWNTDGSSVTVSGGYVYAEGGKYAAGIGSGCEYITGGERHGGTLTVTGGYVEAHGGEDGAGIGGGEDADGGTVTISGGYVYAKGSYGGAGIGGGEGGDGGNVTITGGTVHASAGSGETGNRAIGPGYGSDNYGSLTIGDSMMVYSERMANAEERKNMCWYRTDVHVEPCTHQGSTCGIIDGSSHSVNGCIYCTASSQQHEFANHGECAACHLVSLANNADNSENLDFWNNTEKSVVLSDRTLFKDDSWNTLCLPFGIDNFEGTPLEGADVRTVESASLHNTTLTLHFASVKEIEAGKPYIVRWSSGNDLSNPVFFNAQIDKNEKPLVFDDVVTFQGTYSPFALVAQDKTKLYMGSDNKLYYPKKDMTIKSFRAFFDLDNNGGEAKEITGFVLNFDDSTTEIVNSQLSTVNSNDNYYSLDGRKLNGKPTQKGVYIHKGKKIVK